MCFREGTRPALACHRILRVVMPPRAVCRLVSSAVPRLPSQWPPGWDARGRSGGFPPPPASVATHRPASRRATERDEGEGGGGDATRPGTTRWHCPTHRHGRPTRDDGYRLRHCPVSGCHQARRAMERGMWSDRSDHAETDRQHESVLGTGLRSDGARGVQQVECLQVKAKTGG
jgi:hypothetical protein